MSPEQADGAEVGFASDVYNLGATFYCLLTGENPVPGESPTAVLRRVKKGDFPRPRQVRPEVPPALEAVCLKAMALRPQDRYHSPLDFAQDLECWLADEPVSAWQEPWTVRLARWERKHRKLIRVGGVALGTVALVATTAAVLVEQARQDVDKARARAVSLYQEAEAARKDATKERAIAVAAQQKAEHNFTTSREIADSFIPLLEENLPLMSLSPRVRLSVAADCVKRYRDFVKGRTNDADLLRQASHVFRVAANLHRLLEVKQPSPGGLYEEAFAALDRLEAIEGVTPDSQKRRLLLLSDQGAWHGMEGRRKEAERHYTQAVELGRGWLAAKPDSEELKFSLAVGLWSLSGNKVSLGQFDEARGLAQEAFDMIDPLANKPDAGWMRKLIRARIGLAQIRIERLAGHHAAANARVDQVAAAVNTLEASNPLQPDVLSTVADLQMERAELAIENPDQPRAADLEQQCQEGLLLLSQLYKQHTVIPNYSREFANGLKNRAALYRTATKPGLLATAEKRASDALRVIDSLYKVHQAKDNLRPGDCEVRGDVLAELGRIAGLKGEPEQAARRFGEAAAEYQAALAIDPDLWSARRSLEQLP